MRSGCIVAGEPTGRGLEGNHSASITVGTATSEYHFVMTKYTRAEAPQGPGGKRQSHAKCLWCRVPLAVPEGAGRPRRFCSQACRQWDWVTKQRSKELNLSEQELVITRAELDDLRDRIYVLACAIEDVQDDVRPDVDPTTRDYRSALEWILEAARPVVETGLVADADRPA